MSARSRSLSRSVTTFTLVLRVPTGHSGGGDGGADRGGCGDLYSAGVDPGTLDLVYCQLLVCHRWSIGIPALRV